MALDTIAERLGYYFSSSRITVAQVSRDTGIQYDTLQQILQGRVKAMGVDKFAAIWKAYPDLDAWYIITGEQGGGDAQRAAALTTVEELRHFRDSLDRRIKELSQ